MIWQRIRQTLGRILYPAPGASRDGRQVGRTPLRRCIQCGFPNDTRKVAVGKGDGIRQDAISGYDDAKDPVVTSGCAFCGSHKWLEGNPKPLADDRDKPAREYLRHPR